MPSLRSIFSSSSSSSLTKEKSQPVQQPRTKSKCGCGSKKKKTTPKIESVEPAGCCGSSTPADEDTGCGCGDKKPKTDSCCGDKPIKTCAREESNDDSLVLSDDPIHPANLICELCKLFYNNGWVTGTGGGISIRKEDEIYLAPSGVQKERIVPLNIFVMSLLSQQYIRKPLNLKPSACTPLFMAAYTLRDAGACIHTHSQNAVMCTLLFDKVFEISSIEQIKALPKITEQGNMWYSDKLVIPIIENTEKEEDLEASLKQAIVEYPAATAVLVRRHGIYVWGETVWKAKVYNEAIDYLLELAIKMKQSGIPTVKEIEN